MSLMVSVQIPVWRGVRYLQEAIESVRRQTYKDYEIIVVDDGAKEDIKSLISGYPKLIYVRQEHRGVSEARNQALKQSSGDLISFLDADDLWEKNKLEKQVDYLRTHPECGIVFTKTRNFTGIREEMLSERQRQLLQTPIASCLVSSCIRRELFERYGCFSAEYRYGEDTELMARWAAAGVELNHCLREPLYLRRIHEENMSLEHEKIGKQEYLQMMASAVRRAKNERNGA